MYKLKLKKKLNEHKVRINDSLQPCEEQTFILICYQGDKLQLNIKLSEMIKTSGMSQSF